jgi:HK97 family phage major capsid protein
MLEVKADALEQSFEAFEQEDDGVAALKAELETLKAKIASGVIQAQRPVLDGMKSAESSSFIDQYIRRGIESGLETKAIGSSSGAIGGYAVPQEIDQAIDTTLLSILAHPVDCQCREGRQRGLSRAHRERRNSVGMGGIRGRPAGDQHADL